MSEMLGLAKRIPSSSVHNHYIYIFLYFITLYFNYFYITLYFDIYSFLFVSFSFAAVCGLVCSRCARGWLWPVSCGPEAAGLCSACDRGVLLWIAVDREAEKGGHFLFGRKHCVAHRKSARF